ncbi:hypothetical protein [Sedimenticola selenatireducens]|uniref:hypothetical protein n=1 Tax=Sedimenticola selenatireducens TaxID=191960 RepID=UPI000A075BFD|nr:hypothetical protein [Sedimenticola selenatireducens]
MDINTATPGIDLHLKVRANFITQGTTFSAWCREHGVNNGNARAALIGSWDGPKGRALREKLLEASGVIGSSSAAA